MAFRQNSLLINQTTYAVAEAVPEFSRNRMGVIKINNSSSSIVVVGKTISVSYYNVERYIYIYNNKFHIAWQEMADFSSSFIVNYAKIVM